MINNKRILALITARGGSKRLPQKNILEIAGQPLIAWSIEAGIKSKYVDRIVVSTDDKDIAEVAIKYGAEVPFVRPGELARDSASSIDTIVHAITALDNLGEQYEYLLLLQPTSPLRTSENIDEAVEFLLEKNADAVVGVTEIEHPVEWSNTLGEDLSMDEFIPDKYHNLRSQDLPERYRINGAIYLCRIKNLLEEKSLLLHRRSYAYIMPPINSIDIDNEFDFKFAEFMMIK